MQESTRWLDLVEVTEDRLQVVDLRGRLVDGFNTAAEASAFAKGYGRGRDDAAGIAAAATDPLPSRIGGTRREAHR